MIGGRRARRVGDEDDAAALPAEVRERLDRGRVRGDAVVDDAPDVAQDGVVAGSDLPEAGDFAGRVGHVEAPRKDALASLRRAAAQAPAARAEIGPRGAGGADVRPLGQGDAGFVEGEQLLLADGAGAR